MSFSPFSLQEISVLFELTLGHLRYRLTDVPPQPNSPPDYVFHIDRPQATLMREPPQRALPNGISKMTMKVWPIDPLVLLNFKLEVSEKLPQG